MSTSACPYTDVARWAVGMALTDTALPEAGPVCSFMDSQKTPRTPLAKPELLWVSQSGTTGGIKAPASLFSWQ